MAIGRRRLQTEQVGPFEDATISTRLPGTATAAYVYDVHHFSLNIYTVCPSLFP